MSTTVVDHHPNDDALELYALGQFAGLKLENFEEHLLVCDHCRRRLVLVDAYVVGMKDACHNLAANREIDRQRGPWAWLTRLPVPVWACATALALISVVAIPVIIPSPAITHEVDVTLIASRGSEAASAARGAIRLNIDTTDLTPYSSYSVSLVSASGHEIWSTLAKPEASRLIVRVPISLDAGTYWVRVSGPNREPVREFALHLN